MMKKLAKKLCAGTMFCGAILCCAQTAAQAEKAKTDTYIGDWNFDGVVNLDDARGVLEAALGITNPDQRQFINCSFDSNSSSLSLNDAAQTLNTALGMQKLLRVCSINHEALYESLTEKKPDQKEETLIFDGKEQAVEWAKRFNCTEAKQSLLALNEQDLEGKKILLISRFTYADQPEHVNVSDVQIKNMEKANLLSVYLQDYNSVLDNKNNFYQCILLIDGSEQGISDLDNLKVCDAETEIAGGEQAKVNHCSDYPFGFWNKRIIQTPQELQAFKADIMQKRQIASEEEAAAAFPSVWEWLDQEDSYFDHHILIFNEYSYYDCSSLHLNWVENEDEIKFSLDGSYFFDHRKPCIPDIACARCDVLEISKGLIRDRKVSFEPTSSANYVDFAPAQEGFQLKVRESEAIKKNTLITTDKERQALLAALEESCEQKESDEYAKLKTLLAEADLADKELLVIFNNMIYNKEELDDFYSKMEDIDKLYVKKTDTDLDVYYDYWGNERLFKNGEDGIYSYVAVLFLDRGTIGSRAVNISEPIDYDATQVKDPESDVILKSDPMPGLGK